MTIVKLASSTFRITLAAMVLSSECVHKTSSLESDHFNISIENKNIYQKLPPTTSLLTQPHVHKSDEVQVFDNGTVTNPTTGMFQQQINFDSGSRNYRKRYGGGGGGSWGEYDGGGSFSYEGSYGGGDSGGGGWGYGHKKGTVDNLFHALIMCTVFELLNVFFAGTPNHHYNPSVNKYGGGGPISYNPVGGSGGGHSPPKKPNYGSSYVPNHVLPGGGGEGGIKPGSGGHKPSGGGGGGGGGGIGIKPGGGIRPGAGGGIRPGAGGGIRPGAGGGVRPGVGGGGGGHRPGGGDGGSGGGGVIPEIDISEDAITIVLCEVVEKCHIFVHCASYSSDYLGSKERCCFQPRKQEKGMCCDGSYPLTSANAGRHFSPYPTDTVPVPDISHSSLQTAAAKGYEYQARYRSIENQLLELNIIVEKGTAAHGHLLFFQVIGLFFTHLLINQQPSDACPCHRCMILSSSFTRIRAKVFRSLKFSNAQSQVISCKT